MTKAERSAAIKKRMQAVAVIKNIRRVRRALINHPFDAKTYDALNGKDFGLDELVGKTVIFGSLDEHERLQLRKDINDKLNVAEQEAFKTLREASAVYFSDLQKVIDKASAIRVTDKILTDLDSTRTSALEAFNNFKLTEGSLDYERTMSTLEHLQDIAESLKSNTLWAEQELEHEEYTEEQHEDENDDLPTESDDDTEEDIPDDPLGDDDDIGDDSDSDNEDESSVDVDWIETEEAFRDSAKLFALTIDAYTSEAEFNPNKAKKVLAIYADTMNKYTQELQHLKDTVAADTCTADRLLLGNRKLYKRIDKVVEFVNSIEFLRDALDKSCEGLIKASHEMLLKTTRDPML